MKTIFKWLADHAAALGAIAAITVIVSSLFWGWGYIQSQFRSDLSVYVDYSESTVPGKMISELNDLVWALRFDHESKLDNNLDETAPSRLQAIRDYLTPTLTRSEDYGSYSIDKLKITINNNTNVVISGIKLRVNGVSDVYALDITGDFLREAERVKFTSQENLVELDSSSTFPDLPTLPPESSMTVVVYGDIYNSRDPIQLSANSASYSIVKTVKTTEGFFVWLHNNLGFFLSMMLGPALLILYLLIYLVQRLAQSQANNIIAATLYDRACRAALDRNPDLSALYLKCAVKLGYTELEHIANDKDLTSLRERPDYKELIMELGGKPEVEKK